MAKGLQKLCDCLQQCVITMKHNKLLEALDDCMQIQGILSKLPDWIKNKWSREAVKWKNEKKSYPPLAEFTSFLAFEAEVMCDPATLMTV